MVAFLFLKGIMGALAPFSYLIIIYYFLIINYKEPSQLKLETELSKFCFVRFLTNKKKKLQTLALSREKALMVSAPGRNVIKLFTSVIYKFSLKAGVFVPGKPF